MNARDTDIGDEIDIRPQHPRRHGRFLATGRSLVPAVTTQTLPCGFASFARQRHPEGPCEAILLGLGELFS